MEATNLIIRQKSFAGGLSDSESVGVENSFFEGIGLNIHGKPGMLKPNQKLTLDSGTTITDFVKVSVQGSNGHTYFFGDTGNIYSRSASSGGYTLCYSRSAGDAILGAEEYDGYMYFATATDLHRKPFPGLGDWSDVSGSWKGFTNGDTKYHPMIVNGLYLFVGDGRGIASVDDSGTFTANGTPDVTFAGLPHGYRARCFYNYDIDLLIGAIVDETINKARVFRWDTVSTLYETTDEIAEPGVNAFIPIDNSVFAQCGNRGNFYFYDGKYLREPAAKRLRGNYTNVDYIEINPNAVDEFDGIALFGVSRSAGDPVFTGVYSLGRYDKNYPLALNLEYLDSTDNRTSAEIGTIIGVGQDLFVSWKHGTSYGIDKLDYSNKYASSYLITRDLSGDRCTPKTFKKYIASFKDGGGDSSLVLKYIKNYGTATTLTGRSASDENQIIVEKNLDVGALQIRMDWEVDGNSAMSVEELAVEFLPKKT